MSADITNVINASLAPEGSLADRDNMNIVAILTSQQNGAVNSRNRYNSYMDAPSVATDFGTASSIYKFAKSLFGTQPNPTNADGRLIVGYWRAADENVDATAAVLTGAQLSEAETVPQLQQISDGSMDIDVDGTTEALIDLDFQSVTDLEGAVEIIDTELTGASAELVNNSIMITSSTTGVDSTITFATDSDSGTFVGDILSLSEGSGATTEQGADSETLDPEEKEDALVALLSEVNFKGAMFIDQPTDTEAKTLAQWAQANNVLLYDVFSGSDYLSVDPANVVWDIVISGLTNYRMMYSKSGNRKMAASYMARAHVVNFRGENTALTMNLKELSVSAESYTQAEIDSAKTVGLDLYTTMKLTPVILTSGANDFVDNRYNIMAFIDAVQTDMFNLLRQTGTKITQTRQGVNQLVDRGEKTSRGFVKANVFAPGTWSSPDYFGNRETFVQNIENNGFYWLAGKLADQAQADREARKSPVLQAAVKNAGAIHSGNVIINFNL